MKRFMFRALALFLAAGFTLPAPAQTLVRPPDIATGHPGYVTGRFYTPFTGTIGSSSAVPAVDTVVYLYPFAASDFPLVAVSLNTRCITLAALSAIKLAVWASDPVTKRPTGVPVAGSNTGQATTTSNSTQTIAISRTFEPGVVYWVGVAATTLAPTMYSFNSAMTEANRMIGRSAIASSVLTGLSAPYTYSTDIMALNLTGATLTDVTAAGIPVVYIGT